jgi:outer membrane protein assembly factor BamB
VTCVSDHPEGFELCVNAPAIDGAGNVYANAEDGNLYVLRPDGTLRDQLLLDTALGAAYTPVSLGGNGMIYTQNDGHLFVAGR